MAHITKKAYQLVGALNKEANQLSASIKTKLDEAAKAYAKAKEYWDSCDFPIADCYHPRHAYDEVNSLKALEKDLRNKAASLRKWLDKFEWLEVTTDKGYTFTGAVVSDRQAEFIRGLYVQYNSLLNKYYPKKGDE